MTRFKLKISWFKKHKIASLIILVLALWLGHKIWRHVSGMLFAHPPVTYVETIVLKPAAYNKRWEAVGIVKAAQNIIVESEVTGIVQRLAVKDSQKVRQGDDLLIIRHDDVLANLHKEQAILKQKQFYYEKIQGLFKAKASSQKMVNEALSEFHQAQASVVATQAQLDKYIIKAPFSGVAGIWQVNVGQLVKPGDHLISLTQLARAYIDFMLPAKALGNIHMGDTIQFKTMSYADRVWKGKITAIDPQLDSATRNIQLRAEIDNRDSKLVPYLYGQVVVIEQLSPQLFIPQEAVIYDPSGTSVFVVRNNSASPQPIELGSNEGENVVVVKGLKADDEVVTAGMMKLFPGSPVTVNKKIIQSTLPSLSKP